MVRFLLLPDDERVFTEWAQREHGLELTAAVDDATGVTRLVPVTEPPTELPGPVAPGPSAVPRELVLRAPDWGVNDLEPWGSGSAAARVGRLLDADVARDAGVSAEELVDLERTRVVVLRRCAWTRAGELAVAALQGSARPVALQDPDVTALLRSAERWLTRGAVRVDLPAHLRHRPRILARPCAQAWVASGGVVHPWDA